MLFLRSNTIIFFYEYEIILLYLIKMSDVRRQGLAGLSQRLGLTRRRRLGRARFKLVLLSHYRLNGVFDLKNEVARNELCLIACAQRDSLRVFSCLPNSILEVESLVNFH